jgi:hypothetical protein
MVEFKISKVPQINNLKDIKICQNKVKTMMPVQLRF